MSKTVCQNTLPFHSHRNITARFDGGSLTSDAGWLLFGSLDRQHRLCEGFSSCISESRDQRYIRHDLLKLIRQRVLQIVAGYEDCNDADTLRSDPMLKTVCDQLPESDPDLATQPTFSRLENSVTKKDLMRLSRWLLGRYVRSLKKRRPAKIILDLDSTDDHTHGQQEFSFYHGYYRNHILHPLLIFDADTGDLVCAVLRPGNKGAASHIVPILKRVVEAIRQAVGTDVEIEIRADSGFAKYLANRGLKPNTGGKVWCFIGDGEADEPEVLGTINIAAREDLDNLVLVVNCNLQRLDGPVRGNGKIIQELERSFRGADWNVIKVIWGSGWDRLLAQDHNGVLRKRMEDAVDGDYQYYSVSTGDTQREHWVEGSPELEEMMNSLSDEEIKEIKRGGQDPKKGLRRFRSRRPNRRQADCDPGEDCKGRRPGTVRSGPQFRTPEKESRSFRTPAVCPRIRDSSG